VITHRANDGASIRSILNRAIKRSGKSREQIADEMSMRLGFRITEHMLNAFTAEAKSAHRWPAAYDIAFCETVGDYWLLRDRVRRAGFHMIGRKEHRLLAIGMAYAKKRKAERFLADVTGDEA